MVRLTISVHLQQFEDLKFLIFFLGKHPPGPSPYSKPLQTVQASRISRAVLSRFYLRILNPTQLQSGNEYPDFE